MASTAAAVQRHLCEAHDDAKDDGQTPQGPPAEVRTDVEMAEAEAGATKVADAADEVEAEAAEAEAAEAEAAEAEAAEAEAEAAEAAEAAAAAAAAAAEEAGQT